MIKQLEKKTTLFFLGTALLLLCASINSLGTPELFDKDPNGQTYPMLKNTGTNYAPDLYQTGPFQIFAQENNLSSSDSLAQLINQYRRQNGLSSVPISSSLNYVAQYHVYDLETNSPSGGSCNLHSWSNRGRWTPCCYTADHARASCMWNKPRELTKYTGNGYEIAVFSSGSLDIYRALESWKGSSGHNDVILNQGRWAKHKYKAMGAAISSHYAVVWFGTEADPAD